MSSQVDMNLSDSEEFVKKRRQQLKAAENRLERSKKVLYEQYKKEFGDNPEHWPQKAYRKYIQHILY